MGTPQPSTTEDIVKQKFMREIKFRAWCEANKEMYYADENYSFRIYNGSVGFLPHYNSDELYAFNTNPSDGELKIDVMQYIGLTDKNGKEIYEGDIVTFRLEDNGSYSSELKEVVTFSNGYFKALYPLWAEVGIIVVGNIYENPELLK